MTASPDAHMTLWRPPADARLVASSPAATRIAVLEASDEATVHDLDGRVLHTHVQVPPDTRGLAVSDDGDVLALVDGSRRVFLQELAPGAPPRPLDPLAGARRSYAVQAGPTRVEIVVAPHDLRFAPDGRALLVASHDYDDEEDYYGGGVVASWAALWLCHWPSGQASLLHHDAASRAITYRASDTDKDAEAITAAAFSPTGRWIALHRPRAGLTLRAAAGPGPARRLGPPGAVVDGFAFTPDDAHILLATGARVTTHELHDARELGAFEAPAELTALASRGDRIACLARSGDTSIVTASGAPLAYLPRVHDAPARSVRWVGERLVIGCDDGALVIWS